MRHLPPERAWWLIGCFVVAFDAATPPGTTLSEKMDEWIDDHPFVARAAVVLVAAHLVNAIPPRLDPIHQAFVGVGTIKTRFPRRRRRIAAGTEPDCIAHCCDIV